MRLSEKEGVSLSEEGSEESDEDDVTSEEEGLPKDNSRAPLYTHYRDMSSDLGATADGFGRTASNIETEPLLSRTESQ